MARAAPARILVFTIAAMAASACSTFLGSTSASRMESPPADPSDADGRSADGATHGTPGGERASSDLAASEGFSDCGARPSSGPGRQVQIGATTATERGTRLELRGPEATRLVLGVLGPVNEASGLNLLALRRYLAFFEEQGAHAIVLTGDVGEVSSSIERTLLELARARLPVLVIPGNRECRGDYERAMTSVRRDHDNVIDMARHRTVTFPQAALVSLPGYHDPDYITCMTGCRYDDRSVEDLHQLAAELAAELERPLVLVSHGPPRGRSSQSIDRANTGANVGDAHLNRLFRDGRFSFGVFSNIKEAGGRATDTRGGTPIAEGSWAPELLLNPGPADTTPWEMNDGQRTRGQAAVLVIEGDRAQWVGFQNTPFTTEERKAARALEAAAR